MSTCISKHGEFSSHETDDQFTCSLCGVFDEAGALAAIDELTEAIRFTVEYVGTDTLPAKPGWSWFDALAKYAPATAASFRHGLRRQHASDELPTAEPTTNPTPNGDPA